MRWLRRSGGIGFAVVITAAALTLLDPSPQEAHANVACDVGIAPGAAVTGALGIGNPVGDACNAVTDPVLDVLPNPLDPVKDAAGALGQGIFDQITSWAADGAVWLLGRVVALTNKTTSPNLLNKGFVQQYRQMAQIASVLAVLMLIFAALEGLGRGDAGMLWRVFLVNVPVAALATSAAYVVVQLMVATTDGFSEVIARSTAEDTRTFFKSAIEALSSAGAGAGTAAAGPGVATAQGAVAVPLFVGFIAAIVVAFAAFLVWIELLMRDAAIYAVALFMPMAIAASIWPRWSSALRRTGELLIVVVFSKFVIVSIIALAASLLANTGGKVEAILAAGALMMLACFAPFVLFKLVPFAEGAISSAYNRQGAGGVGVQSVQLASSVSMMRRAALANWATHGAKPKGGTDAGTGGGGSGAGGRGVKVGGGGGGGHGGASAGAGGTATGASGGAAGAVALPAAAGVSAAKGSQAAAGKLASSGTAEASGGTAADVGGGAREGGGVREGAGQEAVTTGADEKAPRPRAEGGTAGGGEKAPSPAASSAPEPTEAGGGKAPGSGTKPPRPSGDTGAPGKGAGSGKGAS
jgi:hypothetical protein